MQQSTDPVAGPEAASTARELEFGGLRIRWDRRILEPRPWTIAQPEWLASLSRDAPEGPALEVCSGAGHMGLALARLTGRDLVQVDVDPVACGFARDNAADAGIPVDLRCAPMDEAVEPGEMFALILADPPWVRRADVGTFPEDPVLAIDGGDLGLDLARSCLALADAHLAPGGHAVLQLGTAAQMHELWAELAHALPRLELVEVRSFERGALAHLRAV
ncbi:methyltransferase domain-containing protein [Nocardioides pacificus]